MKPIPGFVGGSDVQRSLNLSDNKCINLIPTANDTGQIAGFINAPGLLEYLSIPAGVVATGIYRASNGRCFMVAGTTLYEVNVGATLTSRGTVTAPSGIDVTRFTDNGIELILVNGIDGWTLTLATNTLEKIKVVQGTITVTIATPAVFTYVGHTLIAGDRFLLTTTGLLPTGLSTSVIYYVIATGLTADAFQASLTSGGAAINTSGSQSGVHTMTTEGWGFPNGCKTISYMNGRFIACEPNTQNFYVSEVLDGRYWDALNVQTVDSNPDLVIGEVVSHNELIVFCELSGEVFYDSGTIPTPFVRHGSAVFEIGLLAPYSIAKIDNSFMWLGKSSTGPGGIYRMNGYTPENITPPSIVTAIQGMSTVADALAFTYEQDGHTYYVLTFPTGNRSFVYDANTRLWHERASFVNGQYTRWEAQEYTYFDGEHLVCDYQKGKIYKIKMDTYKYGDDVRKWVRSFRAPSSGGLPARHKRMLLEIESGVGLTGGTEQTVMMRWSDDGGHTWSSEKTRDMGAIGVYNKRLIWERLGMTKGQPRIYEISGTSPVKTVLLNAYLE